MLLIFRALAFRKENSYIRVNFIMHTFKGRLILGPNLGPKGDDCVLICLSMWKIMDLKLYTGS